MATLLTALSACQNAHIYDTQPTIKANDFDAKWS